MEGIDVHPYYQRGANFQTIKEKTNVQFVWVKVSDGGSPYAKRVGEVVYRPSDLTVPAQNHGFAVGGYHYAQFTPSPEEQAEMFGREIHRLGLNGVIPPALDLEAPFIPDGTARTFAHKFLARLLEEFPRVAIYGSTSMLKVLGVEGFIPRILVWVAAYTGLPGTYKNQYYDGRADVHQYTNSASIPGIVGGVDKNYLITSFGGTVGVQDDMKAVLAGDWRFDGRNPIDIVRQDLANTFKLREDVKTMREDVDVRFDIVDRKLEAILALLQQLTETGVRLTATGEIVVKAQ